MKTSLALYYNMLLAISPDTSMTNKGEIAVNEREKLAHEKLALLKLVESLGNVSKACRQLGVSRSQFYEYKQRFAAHGLEGLKDRPPIHKGHPFTTSSLVEDLLLEVSLEHPDWGCARLSDYLQRENKAVSSPTIQKILIRHGMRSRQERRSKSNKQLG